MFNQNTINRISIYIIALSVSLSLIGFVVFFLMPIVKEDKSSWVIGTMSDSHKFIEKNCAACHQNEFEPIKNSACESCHNLSAHVVNKHVSEEAMRNVESQTCVSCHFEHSGADKLITHDDRTCVKCHGEIGNIVSKSTVKNVRNFRDHPEFQFSALNNSNLKLNHRIHLEKDIRGENGYQTLGCSDCHTIKNAGLVTPVSYDKNCRSCHKLEIVYGNSVKNVSHTNPDLVFNEIYKEFSASFFEKVIPGEVKRIKPGKNKVDADNELAIIKSEVLDRSRKAEAEIFLKAGCNLCHDVNEKENFDIKSNKNISRFEIVWKRDKSVNQPRSAFNHLKHEILQCESCHADIRESESFDEHSLPEINTCHSCHNVTSGATQNCTSCHAYHESNVIEQTDKKELTNFIKSLK